MTRLTELQEKYAEPLALDPDPYTCACGSGDERFTMKWVEGRPTSGVRPGSYNDRAHYSWAPRPDYEQERSRYEQADLSAR